LWIIKRKKNIKRGDASSLEEIKQRTKNPDSIRSDGHWNGPYPDWEIIIVIIVNAVKRRGF
jgi:hypothetical protein